PLRISGAAEYSGCWLIPAPAGGGGPPPPEATGIESVLAGLRETLTQDDQLLTAASAIFDGLLASFDKGVPST
ncbi:chromate resistance protein, partial [Pseudomonas aeruginosa]|nr:chromate resistance protein [Pseudomonas aeruginosa]